MDYFSIYDVSSIHIDGQAGNDRITIHSAILDSTEINGGSGSAGLNLDTLNLLGTTSPDFIFVGLSDSSEPNSLERVQINNDFIQLDDIEKIRLDARGGNDYVKIATSIPVSITASQELTLLELSDDAHVDVATGVNDLIQTGPAKRILTKTFLIEDNAIFNLNDNVLVIDYFDQPSPYNTVRNYMLNGFGILGGVGAGIDSESVTLQTVPGTMLSLVDNGAINGQISKVGSFNHVPFNSLIISYTWFGDANLDGMVNSEDAALIDTGFTSSDLHGWVFGDLDYNNLVDYLDYGLYDTGFIAQSSAANGIYKPAPTTVRAQMLWDSAIRVSWEAPPIEEIQGYLIWASMDGGEYELVAQVASSANYYDYQFDEVYAATVSFRVAVRSENVVSKVVYALDVVNPSSDTPAAIPQLPDTDPPEDYVDPGLPTIKEPVSPVDLIVKAVENNSTINLRWTAKSDNHAGFIIYRSTDDSTFIEIARVGPNESSYDDADVDRGIRYYYQVVAYNDAGQSQSTGVRFAILKLEKPSKNRRR